MSAAADAVIIGGGIMGLFCAHELAQQRLGRVILLEKRFCGAGSSGKSGAILRQHYSHRTTILMARESLAFYRTLKERTGRDIGFRPAPMVLLCHERERASIESNVSLQRSFGVAVEMLDARQLRELEPRGEFGEEVVGAVESESGFVDPGRTIDALASLCRDDHVDLREGVRVTDVLLDESHRARGVQTDDGQTIESPVVINAGGPWAGILCKRLGLQMPLKVIRPQQAYFVLPGGHGSEHFIFADLLTGFYWKPEAAGWTRVGRMSYEDDEEVSDPDNYDEGVSGSFVDSCRRGIASRLPAYHHAVSWGGCGALYTVTPDAHALIGEVPGIAGFYVVSGFSGHGFKMGPAVGKGVASMITGCDPGGFDREFFDVDRFAAQQAITTSYRFGILG